MLNASEITNRKNIVNTVKKLFVKKNKSKIYLVRIAFHLSELDKTIQIANILNQLGYKVALNLMQISEISKDDFNSSNKN